MMPDALVDLMEEHNVAMIPPQGTNKRRHSLLSSPVSIMTSTFDVNPQTTGFYQEIPLPMDFPLMDGRPSIVSPSNSSNDIFQGLHHNTNTTNNTVGNVSDADNNNNNNNNDDDDDDDGVAAGLFHLDSSEELINVFSNDFCGMPDTSSNVVSSEDDDSAAPAMEPMKKKQKKSTKKAGPKKFRPYQAEKWTERFEELLVFRESKGHCLVPHTYPENPPLARWVKRQRYQYKLMNEGKQSSMTKERVKDLEDIGFIWDSHEAAWGERLRELLAFKAETGNCLVPSNYPANPQLATWVKCQRRQYKLYREQRQTNMTAERIAELEQHGFEWELRSSSSSSSVSTKKQVKKQTLSPVLVQHHQQQHFGGLCRPRQEPDSSVPTVSARSPATENISNMANTDAVTNGFSHINTTAININNNNNNNISISSNDSINSTTTSSTSITSSTDIPYGIPEQTEPIQSLPASGDFDDLFMMDLLSEIPESNDDDLPL